MPCCHAPHVQLTYVNPNPPTGDACEHETFAHQTPGRANHNYQPSRVNGMGRCGCGQDCPTERAWMQHVASLLEPAPR